MALSEEDRRRVARGLGRYWSRLFEETPWLKAVRYDVVVYTDEWIESNQANWNNNLPPVFKNNATALQKTLVFCAVALARASMSLLRQILGEVD